MIIKQIKQIAAVWLLAAVAYGEPNIKLSIESETFYEGQGFEMQVTVLADQPPNDVIIGKSNDFYTQVLQEAIAESNGQRLYVYRYRLIPRKEGVADIPIVSMSIGETDYATESQLISVQTAQKTDKIRLEMNFDRTECFAGEALMLTCTWYTSLPLYDIKALDISAPFLSDPAWKVLTPKSERDLSGNKTIGLPVEGQRIICRIRDVNINKETFKAVTFKRLLIPLREGRLMVEPLRLLCSHVFMKSGRKSAAYPSYFDNDFFHAIDGGEQYRRYGAQSEPHKIVVKPLPENGRPIDFSGVVGDCTLNVTLDPIRLKLGEPVRVTMSLKDHKHPESLILPDLMTLADLDHLFVIQENIGRGTVENAERIYRFLAVPRRTTVREFPKLSLSLFSPENGLYTNIESRAISIAVSPDGKQTELVIEGDRDGSLQRNAEGLWHNLRSDEAEATVYLAWVLIWSLPLWIFLPPLAFVLCIRPARLALLKRNDPQAAQRMMAFGQLKKSIGYALKLPPNLQQEHIRYAVSHYFSVYLGLRAGAMTFVDIEKGIQAYGLELSPNLQNGLQKLFHHADVARFDKETTGAVYDCTIKSLLSELGSLEKGFSA